MNIIVIGCEYTGTTTLMLRVQEWMKDSLGRTSIFHDHFKLPNNSGHPPLDPDSIIFDAEEKRQVLEMSPKLKELFTRYTLYYHSPTRPMKSTDIGGASYRPPHRRDDLCADVLRIWRPGRARRPSCGGAKRRAELLEIRAGNGACADEGLRRCCAQPHDERAPPGRA